MDFVKTILLYMMMLVGSATGTSPEVTPMPISYLPTPEPIVTAAPTIVPTATPRAARRYTTLYVGDTGSDVRRLQNRLKELGYLSGSADGSYGPKTETAVRDFQRRNGLKADGIAGSKTLQVLYDSPDVIYANASTMIPTMAPVTPEPQRPALVNINYVDASTSTVIAQLTARCYGDTWITADSTRVPAGYQLVSNERIFISVRGTTASPATVYFRYQRTRTDAPATGVMVPVYYLDVNRMIVARSTETLYRSQTVYANQTLLPAGYVLSGERAKYVTISGSTASPSPVIFSVVSSAPTTAPSAIVNIYYVDYQSGAVLNTSQRSINSTVNITPNSTLVPQDYTLVGSSYQTVQYVNGRANPSSVTFRYQRRQATATPVAAVQVPVYYLESSSRRLIKQDTAILYASGNVYADTSDIAGYRLVGTAYQYVSVRSGKASPGEVTFFLTPLATPTPTAVPVSYVNVPVYYYCGRDLVGSRLIRCQNGYTTRIDADASVYGSGYILSGSTYVNVTVRNGAATPAQVTFYLTRRATPTPIPVYSVSVPVRYICDGRQVASATVSCQNNSRSRVNADANVYGSDYVLSGSSYVDVTVRNGVATPSQVTFYLTRKATPVPAWDVTVPVRYVCENRLVTARTRTCRTGQTTRVYADEKEYGSEYQLIGSDYVDVQVSTDGTATPREVRFNLSRKVTPVPRFEVSVPVYYMAGREQIARLEVSCPNNATTIINADPSYYPADYSLVGSDTVYVKVSADGVASPDQVIFNLTRNVTPAPSFDVPVEVRYMNGNQTVAQTSVVLTSGRTSAVKADSSLYSRDYILDGSDTQNVVVSADGVASPNPVIFYLYPRPTAAPITPRPAGGDIKKTLPTLKKAYFDESYPVYQGPGTDYYRDGNASYGSGGSVDVFGKEGEWLLIGYGTNKAFRVGYIRDYKLPENKIRPEEVQELSYAWVNTTLTKEANITADPVIENRPIEKLPAGSEVTFLAWFKTNSKWALIEYYSARHGKTVRAFVLGSYLACMQ